jgi:hypothetical protein
MRTREVIDANRYTFRPYAERDSDAGKRQEYRRRSPDRYARVSTEEQDTDPQLDDLRAAGCGTEYASGADRTRRVLARLLRGIGPGETLVVVRLDRLARSIAHLLAVVEGLRAFPLTRPTDTGVGGVLVLQMLGAVAEFERSLIRERIKAACKPPRRADGWAAIRDCVRATQPFCASSQPHAGRHGLRRCCRI